MKKQAASPVPSQFYLSSQLHPTPGLNTMTYAVGITGPLDAARLAKALGELVLRHEALRTRLQMDEGAVVEVHDEDAQMSRSPLEIRDAAETDSVIAEAVEAVRGALSPETRPWQAVLLQHDAQAATFIFGAHRCIWDEVSTAAFAAELSRQYATGASGVSVESRAAVASDDEQIAAGAGHFAASLAGAPPLHGFPTVVSRAKTLMVDARGAEQALDATLLDAIGEAAKAWAVDPFAIMASAAAYVLSQYCGQQKLAIGFPFDLRPGSVGTGAGTLGSFTAMLPLGIDTGAATFQELAVACAARLRDAHRFGATPFHAIIKQTGSHIHPAANPLFQIACVAERDLSLALPGCTCRPRNVAVPPQQVDLFLQIAPGAVRLGYAHPLIAPDMAESFVRSLSVFLQAALAEPTRALTSFPLLSRAEQEALRVGVNGTDEPAFLSQDLYQLITRHVATSAEKPALVCGGTALSYTGLASAIDLIAGRLAVAGVNGPALVGICLPRSVDMVAAMLAVLRGGAAYVPLDPAFPRDRLAYMAEHAGLDVIITTSALRHLFEESGGAVDHAAGATKETTRGRRFVELDRATSADGGAASSPPSAPAARVPADARAYVIYTSGSTGRPKGVAVPRGAAANFLLSMLTRPGVTESDTLCAVTTLSFDIAVLELFAPLCAGGTVVIATEEEARDPRLLMSLMQSNRVTILQATPITWQMLASAGWAGDSGLKALCGGEAMTPALAKLLRPRVRELWNMYGPTETTVWSTCQRIDDPEAAITVGPPIHNTFIYILDDHLRLVPAGVEGRLFIGGSGVAVGYLFDEEMTAKKFLPDPFAGSGRMYDTGDRARLEPDGAVTVLGRSDFQVKLRGFRIELGEIETRLAALTAIEQAVCVVRQDDPSAPELVAYFTLKPGATEPTVPELRSHCGGVLPAHMIPSRFRCLDVLPRTPNGKVDRKALPKPGGEEAAGARPPVQPLVPRSEVERTVLEIWRKVLGIDAVSVNDSFFDLGGTSIAALSVAQEISRRLNIEVSVLRIFEHPTIAALAQFLKGTQADSSFIQQAFKRARGRRERAASPTAFDVAVVGAAGRFPGARNLDELWKNLSEGRETVTTFSREELDQLVSPQDRHDPHYIPARGVLEDIEQFDAAFFGISPNEAELMDPQLRLFMETSWEAFENAGYVGEQIEGPVGVWAGMGNNFYYHYNVLTRPDKLAIMGEISAEIANEKDHIAPRVSHKLNLTGPSLSVHTACSTTLVVVENAYQALISHQVDVALAGGIDIRTPQKSGQRYEEGGVFSIDGHCRPFDAAATGTMFGEGVGAIVLKRLDDALRDNDTIHAIIKGAAVNHDGGQKVSYLAPSIEGQARVVAAALAIGDVNPETISFMEAHGTATPIGDPIEIEALTRVHRAFTQRRRYCAIGSIKGNFGHATTAAGIAGILKIILAMQHRKIPPTLHFTAPNPRIDFANSPFFVNNRLIDWEPAKGSARRAGVSSFGFCGTNAHVVLEEAPPARPSVAPRRPAELVLLSARSAKALDDGAKRLGPALAGASAARLADAAYTTQVGRKRFEFRRCVVLQNGDEAAEKLAQAAGPRSASLRSESENPPVVLLFPGQGSQYINMGLRLYQGEDCFRDAINRCATTLAPHLGCDLRDFLFPTPGDAERAKESLNNTFYTQPAIFTVSYALASQFLEWGIRPSAFVGHSIGEFVAATLAEVMELDQALRLVATRGRLMQGLPHGSMLTVRLSAEAVRGRLPTGIDIAAVNGPELSVVAGPTERVREFSEKLTADGISCRMLHTSHAFHSSMMDGVVEPFLRTVETVRLAAPKIPFVSTVTGDWILPSEATDPSYWARHLRSTVQFSKAVQVVLADETQTLLECGPRRTCASLALQHRPKNPGRVLSSMPDSAEPDDEYPSALLALGGLWLNGCEIDWAAFHRGEERRRIGLPSYPFQRKRFWIDPGNLASFGVGTVNGASTAVAAIAAASSRTGATPDPQAESDAGAAGGDPLTQSVVVVLEEVLGGPIEVMDEDARFVALGFESLMLTQLARILRVRFGFEVTFRDLSERYSTIRLLTEAVRKAQPAAAVAAVVVKETTPKTAFAPALAELTPSKEPQVATVVRELPSTPGQLEMWLSARVGSGATCAYNEAFSIHLRGSVDEAAIARALQALTERHEALRGHFSPTGETFMIEPVLIVPISSQNLTALAPAERAAELARLAAVDSSTPYDLSNGPLFRAQIIRVDTHEVVVILSAHHAASDGWSLDVLLADLGRLYTGFIGATAAPLAPAHGFSDYVSSRETPAHRKQVEASRNFWRQIFATLPEPLNFPFDGQRPAIRSFPALFAQHNVAPDINAEVRAFAQSQGLSFFSVLISAFVGLVHRVTSSRDFVIGIPVAGHPDAGMEDGVGHLVNLVPVRFRVEPGWSFGELCRANNSAILDAREHAAFSFGEIVADLRLARDPSRVPLVAATFTHVQQYAPGKLVFGDCAVQYHLNPRAFEAFEINLNVIEAHDSLQIKAHANSDIYSKDWISWRLREFESLLHHGCTAAATTPISDLPLLPSAELTLLSQDFNRTTREYPRQSTMGALFEEQVDRTPDAVAVVAGDRSISYRDLDRRANQLAHALRRRGVRRGTLVGLCVNRSVDMVVAVLAVLKAGGAYIPLDPAFPAERLAFMIEDSELALVVSQSELARHHGRSPEQTLNLDKAGDELGRESVSRLPEDDHAARPGDAAYILYTSGSTGKPKGVRVHHQAAVNFLVSMKQEPGLGPTDRLLAVTTLSFDIALLELMLPLAVGAQIILATRDQAMDGAALRLLLETHKCTVLQATPVTWRLLIESEWKGNPTFKALCGGEPLPQDLAESLLRRVGELWNMYGPTETTVWSTCARVVEPRDGITIGRPIANTTVWILDGKQNPCPVGVPGEIYIGGEGVALGYLKRPELTSERFLPDPFSTAKGARLYRTGDLGRWQFNGELECLGRTDFQIKIRGFRIELGEIETVLASHPAIKSAVVHVKTAKSGEPQLVGYVLLRDAAGALPRDLEEHLRAVLPPYMIPTAFVVLPAFPLTPNGKVDRKALPDPQARVLESVEQTPRSDIEAKIASVFAEKLGDSAFGRHDDFFLRGGNSLLAVSAIAALNAAFGLDLHVGSIFQEPTVAGLAKVVEKGGGKLKSAIVPLHRGDGTPMVFACGIALYQKLANHLRATCAGFGVYVPAEEVFLSQMDEQAGVSIPELGTSYVDTIVGEGIKGPIVLGGVSFGGLLAFEIARQLKTRGGPAVKALVLLDPILPGARKRDWVASLGNLSTEIAERGLQYGVNRIVHGIRRKRAPAPPPANKNDFLVQVLNGRATAQYLRARPTYNGPTIIVRALDHSEQLGNGFRLAPDLGWGELLTGPVTIADAPGDHLGILTNQETAKVIEAFLARI